MKRAIQLTITSLCLLTLTGCGPDAREIGYAIWIVGPLCWLLMSLGAGLVHKIGGRPWPKSMSQWLPLLTGLVAAIGVAIGGCVRGGEESLGLLGIALFTAGSSSLALGLIAYAMFERLSKSWPFGAFVWPVLVLYLWLPASALLHSNALGVTLTKSKAQSVSLAWWGLPGAYGVLPLILLIIFGWLARRRLKHERAYDMDEVCEVLS